MQNEPVPDDILQMLRAAQSDKDPRRFWDSLRTWYLDEDTGCWLADWDGFVFPPEADFEGARFLAGARLSRTVFPSGAQFRAANFNGEALFRRASFDAGAFFEEATFAAGVTFGEAIFGENASFRGATFHGGVSFRDAVFDRNAWFPDATFLGEAYFRDMSVDRKADFSGASFLAAAHFDGARFQRGLFVGTQIHAELMLAVRLPTGGSLEIDRVIGPSRLEDAGAHAAPCIRFGAMSLVDVELHSFDPSEVRFAGTRDIEKLSLVNIDWAATEQAYTVADERDFLAAKRGRPLSEARPFEARQPIDADSSPSWREIERIYRALRKNHEDRNDRYGGHGWYFAEMEIGRRYADRLLTRRARDFYRVTSGYGLSALRAATSLLVVLAVAFLLFLVPSLEFCPVMSSASPRGAAAVGAACAGWQDTLRVVFLAASLQGAPEGVSVPGLAGNAVWLLARFGGAAMLLSIGVAFRNQIAR